eukprot:1138195-Amphidinium_carterae.1
MCIPDKARTRPQLGATVVPKLASRRSTAVAMEDHLPIKQFTPPLTTTASGVDQAAANDYLGGS